MAGLNKKQLRAAEALSEGQTRDAAAEAAGVSPRTIYRYQNDPEFRRTVTVLTEQRLDAVRGALASSGRRAVDVLDAIAADEDAAVGHRIAAARAVLQTLATVERADHQRRQDQAIDPDSIDATLDRVVDIIKPYLSNDERKAVAEKLDEVALNGHGRS